MYGTWIFFFLISSQLKPWPATVYELTESHFLGLKSQACDLITNPMPNRFAVLFSQARRQPS